MTATVASTATPRKLPPTATPRKLPSLAKFADQVFRPASDSKLWDQRLTLQPPPYTKAMGELLPGMYKGDKLFATLPIKALNVHGARMEDKIADLPQQEEPEWVDWAAVERGQKLWMKHLGRSILALTNSLLIGFSIARFGEVLDRYGYAQSAKGAFHRYLHTSFAIVSWFETPLDDPTSEARKQIYMVRSMHEMARRRSKDMFDYETEGVPLSQLDMVEVLLGFTGVTLSIIERFMVREEIPISDKSDMVACWRLVGYHLGIDDEYNVCGDLDQLVACTSEFAEWTIVRVKTARPSASRLQHTATAGFGMYTPTGVRYFEGLNHFLRTDFLKLEDTGQYEDAPPYGVSTVAHYSMKLLQIGVINTLLSRYIVQAKADVNKLPSSQLEKHLEFVSQISARIDQYWWRIISTLFAYWRNLGTLFKTLLMLVRRSVVSIVQ